MFLCSYFKRYFLYGHDRLVRASVDERPSETAWTGPRSSGCSRRHYRIYLTRVTERLETRFDVLGPIFLTISTTKSQTFFIGFYFFLIYQKLFETFTKCLISILKYKLQNLKCENVCLILTPISTDSPPFIQSTRIIPVFSSSNSP